ncbi:hypothetical protein [Arundinibacter roseus]|uniref:Uncharacterized protein n=1 Tax=Arundinibacter roseus TaxID=2070510 RepID=A0A4R4K1T6_9BACT|nr:hypothetical protein [Arundinibacter roseus]TDB60386.1 hypothetical protein EZE20_20855 [Arundinibacter roseus]
MKPKFQMDAAAYTALMQGMNEQYFVEKKGNLLDFRLYYDDLWLADTAVVDVVHRSKGEWAVDLIFANIHNPLKFIRRYITSHPCPKRAAQKAEFMRRLAAKDQRGTLIVSIQSLEMCQN